MAGCSHRKKLVRKQGAVDAPRAPQDVLEPPGAEVAGARGVVRAKLDRPTECAFVERDQHVEARVENGLVEIVEHAERALAVIEEDELVGSRVVDVQALAQVRLVARRRRVRHRPGHDAVGQSLEEMLASQLGVHDGPLDVTQALIANVGVEVLVVAFVVPRAVVGVTGDEIPPGDLVGRRELVRDIEHAAEPHRLL